MAGPPRDGENADVRGGDVKAGGTIEAGSLVWVNGKRYQGAAITTGHEAGFVLCNFGDMEIGYQPESVRIIASAHEIKQRNKDMT